MKTIHALIAAIIIIGLSSCEENITLDLNQKQSNIVIEGLITNVPDKQYVKISRSSDFYQEGATEKISNATVVVSDDLGNEIFFFNNPNNENGKEGFYFADEDFVGEIGRTYSLTVTLDGKSYQAQDKLWPVASIDSVASRINKKQEDSPKFPDQIYEMLAYMKEPQERKDYYLFKFYRNNTVNLFSSSDIYFTDDVGIGENINGLASPVYYKIDDIARLEIYSLSRNAFLFYDDLNNIMNNDGGMISPPPANPRSNISNGASGFFRTSAVSSASIIISP